MLAKLSVDQALTKAKFHAKKGEVSEAQKLYEAILLDFSHNKRAQEGLADLNNVKKKNITNNPPQEVMDKLINLYNQNQLGVVVKNAQALTKQYPETFMLWNILGASASQLGKLDDAIKAYQKAILLKPNSAEVYSNMGVALQGQGKFDKAIKAYNKALSLNPQHADAYSNMGNVLKDQGKLDEALEAYNKAITLNPNHALAHNNIGNALKDQGELEKAIVSYKNALLLNPDYVDTYYNLGLALKGKGMLDEAVDAYKKAITLNPNHASAYNNMGVVLQGQSELDSAIKAYKKCILLKPDNVEAHQNLSFALLNNGMIKEGLEEYEWRWKTDEGLLDQRHFSKPKWDGKLNLKDKTIFIWCEQGIGDTMNWSSCLSHVTSCAKHVILECQKKLVPLLSRSFLNVEVKAQDRSLDADRDDFDLHLPMGSLYKHFIDEIMENDKADAYLVPDPARVKFWRKRLKSIGKGPYIGVCWKSSVVSAYRLQHYPPISDWSPVLTTPDVTFINLQYTDYADDIVKVQDEFGVTIHNFDDLNQYNDIDDVAALCAALDMVVSTKVTPPIISAGVGTSTKIANWRQSSYNNILTNPVTLSLEMLHKDTWEPWDNVFVSIAEDVYRIKNEITQY